MENINQLFQKLGVEPHPSTLRFISEKKNAKLKAVYLKGQIPTNLDIHSGTINRHIAILNGKIKSIYLQFELSLK